MNNNHNNCRMGKFNKDFVKCGMLKRTPLLTKFERDISGSKVLEDNEIVNRIRIIRDTTDEALKAKLRQEIIMANLGLVVGITKTFNYKSNVETMDVVNEGIVGLSDAIDKFDTSSKKCRFSSYAALHISNAIRVFVYDMSGACHRNNEWKRSIAYQKARKKLDSERMGEYTDEELLDEINKNMSSGHKSRNLSAFLPMTAQSIREDVILRSARESYATNPEYVTNEEECMYSFNLAMSSITDETDKEIIRHMFGLDGREKLDNNGLAEKFGMSVWGIKSRARRIMSKMRETLEAAGIGIDSLNFSNYDDYTSEVRSAYPGNIRRKESEE